MECWAFSSSQYVQEAVRNVRKCLQKRYEEKNDHIKFHLPKKAPAPMSNDYRPEVDISEELDATDAAYYQSLIGIVRWMVELGRVDICCEVSMLSSCLALPREEKVGEDREKNDRGIIIYNRNLLRINSIYASLSCYQIDFICGIIASLYTKLVGLCGFSSRRHGGHGQY